MTAIALLRAETAAFVLSLAANCGVPFSLEMEPAGSRSDDGFRTARHQQLNGTWFNGLIIRCWQLVGPSTLRSFALLFRVTVSNSSNATTTTLLRLLQPLLKAGNVEEEEEDTYEHPKDEFTWWWVGGMIGGGGRRGEGEGRSLSVLERCVYRSFFFFFLNCK